MKKQSINTELFGERLSMLLEEKGASVYTVGEYLSLSASTISRYANGLMSPKITTLYAIAAYFDVNPLWLMGVEGEEMKEETAVPDYPGLIPLKTKRIPIIGTMACGEPVYEEEDFPSYVTVGANLHADAGVRAKGDSMINARIQDGDIVFIRYQPMVDNGEIAAVWVEDGFTIKRIYSYKEMLILRPENPEYDEMIFRPGDCKTIKIVGKAIAFQSDLR